MSHPPPAAPTTRARLFADLPPEWPEDVYPKVCSVVRASGEKVVVLDDDPTGTQTVHGIPVLTEWSIETLRRELTSDAPAFYLLTNSRSLPLVEAQRLNLEIGRNLVSAARSAGRRFVTVSRSDSTLRGHFPGEVSALAEGLGGFDVVLLIPAFIAGGRYTVGDVHYVADGDWLIPASQTDFARDAAFGYTTSNMREWVIEKSHGQIDADRISSLSIETIRRGGPQRVAARLSELEAGSVCVVNAASERDLTVVTRGALMAEAAGRRLLYRTAASFVPLRAGIAPRPLLTKSDLSLPESGGGLIVVGSYVSKTSDQLTALLAGPNVMPIEISAESLLADDERPAEIDRVARATSVNLRRGEDVVVFTSRRLVAGSDAEQSLAAGQQISKGLVAVVDAISHAPRYLLAKGGITSSDVATKGLGVKRAMVLGQMLIGVPVWQLGSESRFPGLIYIVFPGNVGSSQALAEIVAELRP